MNGQELASVLLSAQRRQAGKYTTVASGALLLTDYFCNLESEIKYVWKSSMGIGSILYLLVRYSAFLQVPLTFYYSLATHEPSGAVKHCKSVDVAVSWFNLFTVTIAEAIPMLRTYALCDCSKRLLLILLAAYLAASSTAIALLVITLKSRHFGQWPPPLQSLGGCYLIAGDSIFFVVYILIVIFEAVILGLTLYKAAKSVRGHETPVLRTMYADGVFYFIYIFTTSVLAIIVPAALPADYAELMVNFQCVMHATLSTRIILHLRAAADGAVGDFSEDAELRSLSFNCRVPEEVIVSARSIT